MWCHQKLQVLHLQLVIFVQCFDNFFQKLGAAIKIQDMNKNVELRFQKSLSMS